MGRLSGKTIVITGAGSGIGRATAILMASKGCLPEMVEDLQSALALCTDNDKLSAQELDTISRSVRTGYAADSIEHEWHHFKSLLGAISPTPARKAALIALANGLFQLAKGYPGGPALRASRLAHALSLAILGLKG